MSSFLELQCYEKIANENIDCIIMCKIICPVQNLSA